MRNIISFLVFISISNSVVSQVSNSSFESQKYIVKVFSFEKKKIAEGLLHAYDPNSVAVRRGDEIQSIAIEDINFVLIRKKNALFRKAAIGAGVGFVVGAVSSLSFIKDFSPFFSIVAGAVFAIPGAALGGLSGLHKYKMEVEGDIEKFNKELDYFLALKNR